MTKLKLYRNNKESVDNLILGVQLANISTRCSSHPQGRVESIQLVVYRALSCPLTAIASENDVTSKIKTSFVPSKAINDLCIIIIIIDRQHSYTVTNLISNKCAT